jgi:hypothetical protein
MRRKAGGIGDGFADGIAHLGIPKSVLHFP